MPSLHPLKEWSLRQTRSGSLKAEVEERIAATRSELDELTKERSQLQQKLESEERRAKDKLRRELDELLTAERESLAKDRADLQIREERLAQEQEVLEGRLERITERLSTARDEVVNDFLTLAPLLSKTQLLPRVPTAETGSGAAMGSASAATPERAPFALRDYLSPDAEAPAAGDVSESEFFERFVAHTGASGYVYRDLDLASFHISVKTCDLTVVGGVSGTGKSSLPRLYAEALAGSDSAESSRYQLVGVNPSWLDTGDLLGRVNILDGNFQPSESGLYPLLIHAHEEHRRWATDGGVYMVCLDEMNLAHVEHYFSLFLQVLEMPAHRRRLQCFAPEVVRSESQFARWAQLVLAPALRFVGTVNFDETTKPLSLRVLDRVNLIKLRPGRLGELDLTTDAETASEVKGAPITAGTFGAWRRSAQPTKNVAALLDALREPLANLGCPLSPRRYRALCEFLASAPSELLSPIQALDLQIAQRLLPQIRGLFRREAQEAFEQLVSILEKHEGTFSESLQALEELRTGDYEAVPELVD